MNEFKVGILALLTMASVVYMSVTVTTNQSGFGDYTTFRTIVNDASGIFPKTPVRVAGINAGRISRIELAGNQAMITFELLTSIHVPKDSALRIKTVGFLGDKYLEVVTGASNESLPPNSFMLADESGGMENLLNDAGDIMKDVKVLVSTFREVFAPEGRESPLIKIMGDLETMMSQFSELTTANKDKISHIMDNLDRLTLSLADEVDRAMQDSSAAKMHAILENTFRITNDLQELTADIRAGKGSVGKFLVEDEIADEVRETLASVKKIVSRVDTLRTEMSVFSGANTDYGGETEAEFRLYPSPERFYLLGITTSEFGPTRETVYTTEANGVSDSRVEKIQRKDTYRFNLQLGRRVQNWTFRGGLIQTTGGFGIDYEVPHWGARFSTEVYDYRKGKTVNWRTFTEWQIWNVVYGRIALEDKMENDRSATFSAGLRFTDEDLKGLIGFFL
jgi:phospholipid/cholesterol/gamma-HCH transport system substrate-binding protein